MRIDHKTINPGATAIDSSERAEADTRTGQGTAAARGGADSIQLSSDAKLLHGALKAAADAPAIRADKVDAARQKLASGTLGADAGRLADRLIDDLLER